METQPVVFLGSWVSCPQSYHKLSASSPKDAAVYPIDYADLMPDGLIELFRLKIAVLLSERGFSRFILAGHSVGGALATDFAAHHPEMVSRLVLIDSAGFPPKNLFKTLLAAPRRDSVYGRVSDVDTAPRQLSRLLGNLRLQLKMGYFALLSDQSALARKISVPTTIIWGENDLVTPLQQGISAHSLIETSTLHILRHESHDWIKSRPEKFWQALYG